MEILNSGFSRRRFLAGAGLVAASTAVSACTTGRASVAPQPMRAAAPEIGGDYALMYGPISDGGSDVPAVPYEKIDRQFLRQVVDDPTGQRPGTIVVDTSSKRWCTLIVRVVPNLVMRI